MKLIPVLTSIEYAIPLSLAQFETMSHLEDMDEIDIFKDHNTDVQVTEMSGHFGPYVFIKVSKEDKSQLPKFLKWLEKTSNPTKEYIQGLKDGENGATKKSNREDFENLYNDEDDADNSLYDKAYDEWCHYDMGYRNGMLYGHDRCILEPWDKH